MLRSGISAAVRIAVSTKLSITRSSWLYCRNLERRLSTAEGRTAVISMLVCDRKTERVYNLLGGGRFGRFARKEDYDAKAFFGCGVNLELSLGILSKGLCNNRSELA